MCGSWDFVSGWFIGSKCSAVCTTHAGTHTACVPYRNPCRRGNEARRPHLLRRAVPAQASTGASRCRTGRAFQLRAHKTGLGIESSRAARRDFAQLQIWGACGRQSPQRPSRCRGESCAPSRCYFASAPDSSPRWPCRRPRPLDFNVWGGVGGLVWEKVFLSCSKGKVRIFFSHLVI